VYDGISFVFLTFATVSFKNWPISYTVSVFHLNLSNSSWTTQEIFVKINIRQFNYHLLEHSNFGQNIADVPNALHEGLRLFFLCLFRRKLIEYLWDEKIFRMKIVEGNKKPNSWPKHFVSQLSGFSQTIKHNLCSCNINWWAVMIPIQIPLFP
jgi:hypothetical protein